MKTLDEYKFQRGLSDGTAGTVKRIVILLHGYGSDGNDLISLAPMWADSLPETAFYAPNAPDRCEMSPMGFQWFSLQDRSDQAMQGAIKPAHSVLEHYITQKAKDHNLNLNLADVAIVGFSQGTMMGLYTAPQLGSDCAGVLGYSGRSVVAPAPDGSRFPICAVHGMADEVVPFDSLEKIKQDFSVYSVETHARPGLGHSIDQQGLDIGLTFLKTAFGLH